MLTELLSKISWLESHCSRGVVKTLHATCVARIQEFFLHNTVPHRVQDLMSLDLVYCILKNARWSRLPIFKEILTDFMASQYSLEQEACTKLVHSCCEHLNDFLPSWELDEIEDKNFLKFLYISTLSVPDLDEQIRSLGFGSNIFEHIRKAAEVVRDSDLNDDNGSRARFVPEIQAAFIEIIIEICAQQIENPTIVEATKLNYAIADLPPLEKIVLKQLGTDKLLSVLTALGMKRDFNLSVLHVLVPQLSIDQALEVVHSLQQLGLVFMIEQKNKPEQNIWCLSPQGLHIAARHQAREFWTHAHDANWEKFFGYGSEYQVAIFSQLPDNCAEKTVAFLKKRMHELSPKGFAKLLSTINNKGRSDLAETMAQFALRSERFSSWHRKAACEFFCAQDHLDDPIRLLLKNVAESDSSNLVKDVALFGLGNGDKRTRQDTPTNSARVS